MGPGSINLVHLIRSEFIKISFNIVVSFTPKLYACVEDFRLKILYPFMYTACYRISAENITSSCH